MIWEPSSNWNVATKQWVVWIFPRADPTTIRSWNIWNSQKKTLSRWTTCYLLIEMALDDDPNSFSHAKMLGHHKKRFNPYNNCLIKNLGKWLDITISFPFFSTCLWMIFQLPTKTGSLNSQTWLPARANTFLVLGFLQPTAARWEGLRWTLLLGFGRMQIAIGPNERHEQPELGLARNFSLQFRGAKPKINQIQWTCLLYPLETHQFFSNGWRFLVISKTIFFLLDVKIWEPSSNWNVATKNWLFGVPAGTFKLKISSQTGWSVQNIGVKIEHLGVSLNGGTPKTPQNDHF